VQSRLLPIISGQDCGETWLGIEKVLRRYRWLGAGGVSGMNANERQRRDGHAIGRYSRTWKIGRLKLDSKQANGYLETLEDKKMCTTYCTVG
jgi:hypothetical protein